MTDLHATLDALREVDAVDQKIQDLERTLTTLPEEQSALDAAVAGAEAALAEVTDAYALKDNERAAKEEELNQERDNVKKSQNRLNTVKNNMEYSAVMREINAMKRDASILEEAVLQLMEELEGMAEDRTAKQDALDAARASRTAREEEITAEIAAAKKTLQELEHDKAQLAARIPPAVLSQYARVRSRYTTGPVIVAAREERCSGCHMNIPPQVYNQVRRSEAVVQCPNCSRLLIWHELLDDVEAAEATAGA